MNKKLIIFTIFTVIALFAFFLRINNAEIYREAAASIVKVGDNLASIFAGNSVNPQVGEGSIESASSAATIIFNPTGTHIKDGQLKVRVDIYPAPGFKTYEKHYVDGQLTPMLSHFITVSEETTKEEFENYVNEIFTPDVIATLDNALVQPNAIHLISPYMKTMPKMQANSIKTADEESVINAVNARLNGLSIKGTERGSVKILEPGSIDVGPGAISRPTINSANFIMSLSNPANATGTLDTFQLYINGTYYNAVVGTVYGSSSFTSRDYEAVGTISGAPWTQTGLSIDVNSGDYIGSYGEVGDLYQDTGVGDGGYVKNVGVNFPFTNESTLVSVFGDFSQFATGVESSPTPTPTPTPEPQLNFSGINIGGGICLGNGPCSWSCGDFVRFNYKGSPAIYGSVSSLGKCWMDRNLGASRVATAYNDYLAYGDLFQWGREDDGHQSRTCTGSGSCTSDHGTVEGDMSLTTQPGINLFITEATSPYDWASNAWTSRWTIAASDPCPDGWRAPTDTELDTERASWAQQNYNGAYASPLKLTVGGYRNRSSGSLVNVGSWGNYWSSVVDGSDTPILNFYGSYASVGSFSRAYGFSVRCIQN
jgi:hypothetical protein